MTRPTTISKLHPSTRQRLLRYYQEGYPVSFILDILKSEGRELRIGPDALRKSLKDLNGWERGKSMSYLAAYLYHYRYICAVANKLAKSGMTILPLAQELKRQYPNLPYTHYSTLANALTQLGISYNTKQGIVSGSWPL